MNAYDGVCLELPAEQQPLLHHLILQAHPDHHPKQRCGDRVVQSPPKLVVSIPQEINYGCYTDELQVGRFGAAIKDENQDQLREIYVICSQKKQNYSINRKKGFIVTAL